MYSKNAMPQLASTATMSGLARRSRRCAYQANVMNTFERTSSTMVWTMTGVLITATLPVLLRVLGQSAAGRLARDRTLCGEDVAVGIDRHALAGRALRLALGQRVRRDELQHLVFLRRPDAHAGLPVRVPLGARLRVDRVELVVACDEQPAHPAELLPLLEELAVLIEDLD